MAEQVLATGIILAGGKSSRMGSDKSLLPWGEANLSLTEIVFANLQPICQQILLVSNSKDK
ncbi:MAG: NTP transferase domain-containing protein, partial [Clostridiales bacterium]